MQKSGRKTFNKNQKVLKNGFSDIQNGRQLHFVNIVFIYKWRYMRVNRVIFRPPTTTLVQQYNHTTETIHIRIDANNSQLAKENFIVI